MRQIEILAPVGGREQLIAAVRCGADAVYLGTPELNARRNAQNFDEPALMEAIAYCHAHDTKVHITLNTLVTDRELKDAAHEIERIACLGADAVIVQDLGVAKLVRNLCPEIALHASTQMSIHNIQGVEEAKRLGFSRVVLARELTAQEIQYIAGKTDLELEMFVHGALCMSVSGMCYLSSMLGERSGNRGLCAQPCRLDFRLGDRPFALSLKDMSLVEHARKLQQLGVCSLKIEGRMKRPEYVAAAVTALRQALDGQSPDLEALESVFSRSGFTDGYFTGRRNADMFGYRTHQDVLKAEEAQKRLSRLYARETQRCKVEMRVCIQEGRPITLHVRDARGNQVLKTGETPQIAKNRATGRDDVEKSMKKTGDTPFFLDVLETDIAPGLMVPASALNRLRASALEALYDLRAQVQPKSICRQGGPQPFEELPRPQRPALRVRLQSIEQYDPVFKDAQAIILPAEEILRVPDQAFAAHSRLIAELPALLFPREEQALPEQLHSLYRLGVREVLCPNLGMIEPVLQQKMMPIADSTMNILNREALREYQALGVQEATLSVEIHQKQALSLPHIMPCGIVGYGHLALMTMRACPARRAQGCGSCQGYAQLVDRKGKHFFLACHQRQFAQLYNPVALYLGDVQKDFSGLDFLTLFFTRESASECTEVYRAYQKQEPAQGSFTRGLYFRQLK